MENLTDCNISNWNNLRFVKSLSITIICLFLFLDEDEEDSSQKSLSGSVSSRQQLKQCTQLLNEILKRDDAEYFLDPVNTEEVSYLFSLFISCF